MTEASSLFHFNFLSMSFLTYTFRTAQRNLQGAVPNQMSPERMVGLPARSKNLTLTSRRPSNRIAFPKCTFEMGIAPLKPPSAGPKDFAEMVLSM